MTTDKPKIQPLSKHRVFQQLFWAHTLSLVGGGLTSLALGLLAHELVGASASTVLGITLGIRILVIVISSPWAGFVASRFGARRAMVASDIMRVFVVVGFFYADAVWQIYLLAVFLNLGSAIFTPIYRAVIPEVVEPQQYPKALAIGSIAYDAANILGPSLSALVIALIGFKGNFLVDGATFLISAALLFGLPRLGAIAPSVKKPETSAVHGIKAMFQREPLRRSLFLAVQVSVAGAFVIVATVNFIKDELSMSDNAYAWVMAAFGLGSAAGAVLYGKVERSRGWMIRASAPIMILSLMAVALAPAYVVVVIAWGFIGAAYAALGIHGSELLAANSQGEERPHVYAAHFALSHAGWGLTYPIAGFLTTGLGFSHAAWWFAGLLVCVSIPVWIRRQRKGES
jgi:MFS transporter, NRE family, putaive nickel resistance protein